MAPSWSERAQSSNGLPNLGVGGTVASALITSFFAAGAASTILVILAFGPRAYFVEGLRIKDWKHGILSTGHPLPFPSSMLLGLVSLVCWVAFIFCTEWIAGLLLGFRERSAPWVSEVCRLTGGVCLLLLSGAFYFSGFPPIHPIPIATLVAGVVLAKRGITGLIRRKGAVQVE